jgi:hypothetical protein
MNFLGGSLFTSPPEEAGDLLIESKNRKSWWGERNLSVSSLKKSDKEKQGSAKEKPKEKPAKEKKGRSKGDSEGEKDKVEMVEVMMDGARAEVVGNGSPPTEEDKTGEGRTVDGQLKTSNTEETNIEDDTERSLRGSKSLRSLTTSKSTQESQGSTKPSKRGWSLMIPRKSSPDVMPMPNKKFTVDVGGPRFEAAREPEEERCAGDNPSIYLDGFVSFVPSPYFETSRRSRFHRRKRTSSGREFRYEGSFDPWSPRLSWLHSSSRLTLLERSLSIRSAGTSRERPNTIPSSLVPPRVLVRNASAT